MTVKSVEHEAHKFLRMTLFFMRDEYLCLLTDQPGMLYRTVTVFLNNALIRKSNRSSACSQCLANYLALSCLCKRQKTLPSRPSCQHLIYGGVVHHGGTSSLPTVTEQLSTECMHADQNSFVASVFGCWYMQCLAFATCTCIGRHSYPVKNFSNFLASI